MTYRQLRRSSEHNQFPVTFPPLDTWVRQKHSTKLQLLQRSEIFHGPTALAWRSGAGATEVCATSAQSSLRERESVCVRERVCEREQPHAMQATSRRALHPTILPKCFPLLFQSHPSQTGGITTASTRSGAAHAPAHTLRFPRTQPRVRIRIHLVHLHSHSAPSATWASCPPPPCPPTSTAAASLRSAAPPYVTSFPHCLFVTSCAGTVPSLPGARPQRRQRASRPSLSVFL